MFSIVGRPPRRTPLEKMAFHRNTLQIFSTRFLLHRRISAPCCATESVTRSWCRVRKHPSRRRCSRFVGQLDINSESISGLRLLMPTGNGSGLFAPAAMSALQKYKVKKIDLFSVTVTNSFLGERVGNKKTPTPTSAKKYEN